jgi:hypothetical protein
MATLAAGEKARMYALGKIARGGATRGGYTSMQPFITIGGVHVGTAPADPTKRVIVASLSIHDTLDEAPNTLQMTVKGFAPTPGQAIVITLGSKNSLTRWFGGVVLSTNEAYLVDNPANLVYQVNGIDYHWQLANKLAIRRYTGWTAGAVIRDLVATFAEGFTTANVAAALDTLILDEITFTNTAVPDAISQVCDRIGAYWYADYFKDVHAFLTETQYATPPALTPAHPTLREVTANRDLSQIVTRAIVEGGGAAATTELAPGGTLIPVETPAWYQAAGGFVVSGPQRIVYTGLQTGGAGTLVGPGLTPAAAPGLALQVGAGLSVGAYQYAYTFVTASGETLPSPAGAITTLGTTPIRDPVTPITNIDQVDWPTNSTGNPPYVGETVYYTWSMSTATNVNDLTKETWIAPQSAGIVVQSSIPYPGRARTISFYIPGYTDYQTGVNTYHLWRYRSGNPQWLLIGKFSVGGGAPIAPLIQDVFADSAQGLVSGGNAVNPAQCQVVLSGIAVGPSGTTARKLYRTTVGGAQLKLLATLADNTTTAYTDTLADASLGANAPASDTSGLQMPSGTVPAGSTTLRVAGTSAFLAGGGYAVIGNGEQVIRYTGVAGGALTGIPASGAGSITASVAYNSTVTAAPMLTGIPASGAGAILYPIKEGDDVNLLVQVDDAQAQADLAALLGGSGVKESYIQDRRLGFTEATARGKALLASRRTVLLTLAYSVRDPNTRSGRTVHVDLPAPFLLTVDLKIQDVTIGPFWPTPGLAPLMKVTASSNFYSLADLLRVARNSVGA